MTRVTTTELSVVICTHNRYDALAGSVKRLIGSPGFANTSCELLVVDNTPAARRRPIDILADDACDAHRIRVTVCDIEGLSHARNHAIEEAKGEVIAFLDDDALVSNEWCSTILRRMRADRDMLVIGGRVAPLYTGDQLPPWYDAPRLEAYLSCIDWGSTPRYLRDGEWVVGANIAFRREVFDTYGTFDASLGRRGSATLMSNEETALLARFGLHRVFYEPAMAVQHVIPVERLTTRWFRRRVFWQAISDLTAGIVHGDDPAVRAEYGAVVARLEARHRNLNALTFESDDREIFRQQLRAIYLAAVVLGHGGLAD